MSDGEILIPLFFGELIYFVLYAEFSNTVVNLLVCTGLEEQLDQAKKHVEQFRSMSEANESALGDLNKVS